MNLAQIVALLVVQIRSQQDLAQPDDGVHRCADLVAHVRQELALEPAGGLCLLAAESQGFLRFTSFLNVHEHLREHRQQSPLGIGIAMVFAHRIETHEPSAPLPVHPRYGDRAFNSLGLEHLSDAALGCKREHVGDVDGASCPMGRDPIGDHDGRNGLQGADLRLDPGRAPFVGIDDDVPFDIVVEEVGPIRADEIAQMPQRGLDDRIDPVRRQTDIGCGDLHQEIL